MSGGIERLRGRRVKIERPKAASFAVLLRERNKGKGEKGEDRVML